VLETQAAPSTINRKTSKGDSVMATKKNTTNERAPRKQKPEAHMISSDDLGALLAAAFAHPLLPSVMWDFIADGLCEIDNTFDKYENPEVMREVLGLNAKGGAR
jgi:hypothetical protein